MGIGNDRSERGGEKEKTKQVQRISSRFFFFCLFNRKALLLMIFFTEATLLSDAAYFLFPPLLRGAGESDVHTVKKKKKSRPRVIRQK